MSALIWFTVGVALWHFTVFVPDRFWGGIVGAFLAASIFAALFGIVVNGGSIPGTDDTDIVQAMLAIPRAAIRLGLSYSDGARVDREHGIDHGHTRDAGHS